MSRIGKTAILIPSGVTIQKQGEHEVVVKGPKGEISLTLPEEAMLKILEKEVYVETKGKQKGSLQGTIRALINNAVIGTTQGFTRTVELVGVGYRASGSEQELLLQIGFSHPVKVKAAQNIRFAVSDNTKITISGIDKKQVGETAANLRSLKPPEPYKGKGIRYQGEIVRKKVGKAVKAAGA